jgi:hypothetical protein
MKLIGTRCLTTTDKPARHAIVFSFFVLRIQNDETQRSLVLFSAALQGRCPPDAVQFTLKFSHFTHRNRIQSP